jgi:glutathione S-transferase
MSAPSLISKYPTVTRGSSEELSKHLLAKPVSYKFIYFNLHGKGHATRNILTLVDAKWEDFAPEKWPELKPNAPFGVLPILFETNELGGTLEIAETFMVERHLAKKHDLLGSNEWETHLIEALHANTDDVSNSFTKVITTPDQDRHELANKYYGSSLKNWIIAHERYLAQNGSNGHYVGDKFSLADIKTATFLERLLLNFRLGQIPISAEETPNIWKLWTTYQAHPIIAKWQKSERFEELNHSTLKMFKLI